MTVGGDKEHSMPFTHHQYVLTEVSVLPFTEIVTQCGLDSGLALGSGLFLVLLLCSVSQKS